MFDGKKLLQTSGSHKTDGEFRNNYIISVLETQKQINMITKYFFWIKQLPTILLNYIKVYSLIPQTIDLGMSYNTESIALNNHSPITH